MTTEVTAAEAPKPKEYKDKNGVEITEGAIVLIPCRVAVLGGNRAALVKVETIEAHGHEKAETKTSFWARPGQLEINH